MSDKKSWLPALADIITELLKIGEYIHCNDFGAQRSYCRSQTFVVMCLFGAILPCSIIQKRFIFRHKQTASFFRNMLLLLGGSSGDITYGSYMETAFSPDF